MSFLERGRHVRERIQSSRLLSLRRAVFAYAIAVLIALSDMWLVQLFGIRTPEELLVQTLVHGTGFYLGYTFISLVVGESWSL
jgi:hypothetical protein